MLLDEEHQYPADPCGALAAFKLILEKARRQTVRELSRTTPDSLGAKLLTALDCVTSLQKQAPRHAHAMLRGVGTCWEMLRPNLL